MASNNTIGTCDSTTPQYAPIIHGSPAFQNAANTVYESTNAQVVASRNGTLGEGANGQPIFKSDYARMQYLLGKQNRANCGVAKKVFGTRF